ncbi:hypothetical protein [Tessaracoccus coleopterorum]|uniref:hypothetical protein n=1 Tax=Tessaracoccus coleopterorum TaxID=2714950 RepID=UPI001E3B236F|nr:hypothetical protein [Tessaracoccus coleopterorum]
MTLEFLGPLALAVIGSRRLIDLLWVGLAAAGWCCWGATVGDRPDRAGLALLAGALWAGYIVLAGLSADGGRASAA